MFEKAKKDKEYGWRTRFIVGSKVFIIVQKAAGMWHLLPEQFSVQQIKIESYFKSNFAKVTYVCSDGKVYTEGKTEKGETIPNVLFPSLIEAKSACNHRNRVQFI